MALLSAPANASETHTYVIENSDYSHYRSAVLKLTFDGDAIAGDMTALKGDDSPPIRVSGQKTGANAMTLKFDSNKGIGFKGRTLSFSRAIEYDRLHWREAVVDIWRPRYGELSEAAKTLTYQPCGDMYGSLNVERRHAASGKKIRDALLADQELSGSVIEYESLENLPERGPESFPEEHRKELKSGRPVDYLTGKVDHDIWYIFVPTGTEAYYATKLRATGLFYVDFDIGGCAGADRSYFTVGREKLFDSSGRVSEQKMVSFINTGLDKLLSGGGKYKYWKSKPQITKVKIPPYPVDVSYEIRAASEITRGTIGQWDQLRVSFEPFDNVTRNFGEYSILLWAERMKSVRRSAGSDSPPDETYFKKDQEYYDEAIAATSIANGLGEGDCVFARIGFEDVVPKKVVDRLKCSSDE